MKKIFLLLMGIYGSIISAQENTGIAISRDTIYHGNAFYLLYTIGGNQLSLPTLTIEHADILSQSSSSNTSILNGEIKTSHKQKFLIRPHAPGLFVIPTRTIQSGKGQNESTEFPRIEVYVKPNPNQIEEEPEMDSRWQTNTLSMDSSSKRKTKKL
jgi:hypothetical protein